MSFLSMVLASMDYALISYVSMSCAKGGFASVVEASWFMSYAQMGFALAGISFISMGHTSIGDALTSYAEKD